MKLIIKLFYLNWNRNCSLNFKTKHFPGPITDFLPSFKKWRDKIKTHQLLMFPLTIHEVEAPGHLAASVDLGAVFA